VFEDRSRTTRWRPGDNDTTLQSTSSQTAPFPRHTGGSYIATVPFYDTEDGDEPWLELHADPAEPENRIEEEEEDRSSDYYRFRGSTFTDTANPDPPLFAEFGDQLLLYTAGQKLCLGKPGSIVTRYILTDERPPENNEYFCTLEVVPSLSMVFVSSPSRIAWIFRMVYYPDEKCFDLVPEHTFGMDLLSRRNHITYRPDCWKEEMCSYIGAVVQPLHMGSSQESNRTGSEDMGNGSDDSAAMGVKIVSIARYGRGGNIWSVRRIDEAQVGVQDIIL
jgi:hypothetical protein